MKFKSERGTFWHKNNALIDMVQGRMAMHIEVALKTTAGMPVSAPKAARAARGQKKGRGGGHMKSETRHFRSPSGGFRVEVDKAYAAYQERGMRADGSHVVRHYSTPGTSKGFFRRAINSVVVNRDHYISEARSALNL